MEELAREFKNGEGINRDSFLVSWNISRSKGKELTALRKSKVIVPVTRMFEETTVK